MIGGYALARLLTAGVLASTACRPGISPGGSAMTGDSLRVTLTTDRTEYATGDSIVIVLQVTNTTDSAVVFEFTSGQRFDFVVLDDRGDPVWRWSADRVFIQMLGAERLEPSESLAYEESFRGSLPTGSYTVVGMLVATNEPLEASTTIAVR